MIAIIKCEFHRLVTVKRLLIIFLINLFNDIIGVSLYKGEIGFDKISACKLLFCRFYCGDFNVLLFSLYVSLPGIICWIILNSVLSDNQKYGVFRLVRMSRLKYIISKILSVFIFVFCTVFFTVMQSFITHRLCRAEAEVQIYIKYFVFVILYLFAVTAFSLMMYSLTKKVNFVFLLCFVYFTAQVFALNKYKFDILRPESFYKVYYIYELIIALSLITFSYLTYKGDFLTTKIKE